MDYENLVEVVLRLEKIVEVVLRLEKKVARIEKLVELKVGLRRKNDERDKNHPVKSKSRTNRKTI